MFKKYILFIALTVLVTGCDAPQRTRTPGSWVNGSSLGNIPGGNPGSFNTSPVAGPTTPGTLPPATPGTTATTGFEGCDLTISPHHTIDIGHFNICQSTLNETLFKFKPTISSSTTRVCLIPTYKDGSGSSTYVGRPQCAVTTANQVTQGTLYKDRPGFANSPINSVIVLREALIPEYMACMHAYAGWPQNACTAGPNSNQYCAYWSPRCPGGAVTNPACQTEARNYMGQICNSFKTRYSNAYLDLSTR